MTDIAIATQPMEPQNVDIALCDGQYIFKFDSNHINEKTLSTLKQAVFNALKPRPKRIRKKVLNADLTPEQILLRRASRLRWYNTHKEHAKSYIKNKYHNDYDFWKKTTDYEREKRRLERVNVEPKKRGRKPKISTPSTTASDDDKVLKTKNHKIRQNKISQNKGWGVHIR
jgi:hypothetical protein